MDYVFGKFLNHADRVMFGRIVAGRAYHEGVLNRAAEVLEARARELTLAAQAVRADLGDTPPKCATTNRFIMAQAEIEITRIAALYDQNYVAK